MRSMCIAHLICGLKSTSSRSMRRYAFASHPASDHQNQRKLMCRLLEIYQVLTLFVFIISPWSMRIFLRGNLLQEKARVTIAIINNKCCKSLMTFLWVSEGLLKFLWTALLYDLQNTNLPKLLIVFHYYVYFYAFSELQCSLYSTQHWKGFLKDFFWWLFTSISEQF